MKLIKKKGLDGKEITLMKPETRQDVKKLLLKKDLDDRESFGDTNQRRP